MFMPVHDNGAGADNSRLFPRMWLVHGECTDDEQTSREVLQVPTSILYV